MVSNIDLQPASQLDALRKALGIEAGASSQGSN